MGLKIEYDLDLAQPTRALNALSDIDKQQLAEDIGELLLEETLFNFEKEQSPTGEQKAVGHCRNAALSGHLDAEEGPSSPSKCYIGSSTSI